MACACSAGLLCDSLKIVSYECDVKNVVINYAIVLLTTLAGWQLLHAKRQAVGRTFWCGSSAFFWSYQIGLCLVLRPMGVAECSGISIVWSAQVGVLWWLDYRGHLFVEQRWLLLLSSVVAALAWTYYSIIDPPITSVAHAAAVGMGGLVAFACERYAPSGGNEKGLVMR